MAAGLVLGFLRDEDFQNPLRIPDIPGYGVIRLNVFPTGFNQTAEAL